MFCPKCGASVDPSQVFCIRCGMKLEKNQQTEQPASSEEVIGVVPFVSNTAGIGMYDLFKLVRAVSQNKIKQYTLVATSQRIIFAEFSAQMMQEELKYKKSQAQGFMGKLLAGRALGYNDMINYSQKYLSMTPNQVINETPGNIVFDSSSISRVKVELEVETSSNEEGPDEVRSRYVLVIESDKGDHKFSFRANPEDVDVLRRALGDKVEGSGRIISEKPLFG